MITGSTFKNPEVLEALGVKMLDGKLQGLAARSVVVLDTDGTVLHSELVPESRPSPTTTQRSPRSADPQAQPDRRRARASGPG